MSRQNFYKTKKRRKRKQIDEEKVAQIVKEKRRLHPRIGTRKLWKGLAWRFEQEVGVHVGRDRLFDILRERDMLIKPKKSAPTTTASRHTLPTYSNVLKDRPPGAAHEAWVSDLTYIRTQEGFMYLSLITDAYSRKVVGYHVGDSLEASGCLHALRQALTQLPAGAKPLHHSDRGTQYCCKEYVKRLKDHGITISMTEENHCYENAQAERMNGILKGEYGLDHTFRSKEDAVAAVHQAIWLYNTDRPHLSLDYRMPIAVHREAA